MALTKPVCKFVRPNDFNSCGCHTPSTLPADDAPEQAMTSAQSRGLEQRPGRTVHQRAARSGRQTRDGVEIVGDLLDVADADARPRLVRVGADVGADD